MNKIANQFTSIEQVADQYLNQKTQTSSLQNTDSISFAQILESKQNGQSQELHFSKHAAQRLDNRNISLSEEQSERLASGVQKASEKGIKDSLVMVDSLAFVVNIPNKTVVTAMDKSDSQNNVFTNIDGAVIA
jgi:flagellar operon protein